ncbi:hypothetical protein [Caldivirga maquilingensis]|nr:hypothetical protein [Caldivirga maquilingensis]
MWGRGVEYVDDGYASRTCPICRIMGNHGRIERGLFKYYVHDEVFWIVAS